MPGPLVFARHPKPTPHSILCCAVLVCALLLTGCQRRADAKRIEPVYDPVTGKLQLLRYDSNGNGAIDTWSYMEGARAVRIDLDSDEDGKIDRWEYYGSDRRIEKIGFSRAKDGKEDAWSFPGPAGSIERVEISTRRDGKITRVEHFEGDHVVAAEDDGDADGRIDKWETYEGDRLASVAFDTLHRGTADRRLLYGADGTARLEVDLDGDGRFTPASEPASRRAR